MLENQSIKRALGVSRGTRKFISGRLKIHRGGKKCLGRNSQRPSSGRSSVIACGLKPCRNETLPEDRALFALGPEHLLAVNLVIGDCLLAFVRNEPVDELLAKLLLHMRMLGRVN